MTPPAHDVARGHNLHNLAMTMVTVFRRDGDFATLQEAMEIQSEAFLLLPPEDPVRATAAANLSDYLVQAFDATWDASYLDRAVDVAGVAEELTRSGRVTRFHALSRLGVAHVRRFEARGDAADLDAAERWFSDAAAIVPADDRKARSMCDTHLGVIAGHRIGTGDGSEHDHHVDLARHAVTGRDPRLPEVAGQWNNLATSLARRFLAGGRQADYDEARRILHSTAGSDTALVRTRLQAARTSGTLAADAGRWDDAVEDYTMAIDLLPLMAARALVPTDQQHRLAHGAGIARDATACALNAGRQRRAVELAELGRGVLLARQLDGDGAVERDRVTDATTARLLDELADVGADLEEERRRAGTPDVSGPDRDVDRDRRHRLEREWSQLVERIRGRPGHAGFLRPPEFDELARAARSGPVVIVNVSRIRCDALIVRPDGVEVVTLPGLSPDAAHENLLAFATALHEPGGPSATDALRDTLAWLWHAVARPVLEALHVDLVTAERDLPRIWWCPTGELSSLPLHAAGTGRPGENVLDRAVSSYTTTLRALRHAGERRPAGARDRRVLAVAVAETPGGPWAPLPGAAREVREIATALPTTSLEGADAVRAAVVTQMATHSWVHFACHAVQNFEDPSLGLLLLHDYASEPLNTSEISRFRHPGAELAFLSACQTAISGTRLTDEGIHVAGAFQLAGYVHVVATQWPVRDTVAREASRHFYRTVRHDSDGHLDAAVALHATVRELRRRFPDDPSCWASHVHLGP